MFFFFLFADPSLSPCTGVPSSPRNVISIVNETSVILEWHSPRETGGRHDVVYNIVCKKCRTDRRACSHCDDNVDFVPRQLGLTETRVFISNLLAHTLYSFEIQAVNGVSNKSPYPAQHVTIDITTNQAGKCLLPASLRKNMSSSRPNLSFHAARLKLSKAFDWPYLDPCCVQAYIDGKTSFSGNNFFWLIWWLRPAARLQGFHFSRQETLQIVQHEKS